MTHLRAHVWAAAVLVLLAGGARAEMSFDHPAQQLVHDTTTAVFATLEKEPAVKSDQKRLVALVESLVTPHFDFELMSKRVLGKNWRRATEAERKAFVAEFRTLLVRTYSNTLAEYAGQKVTYLPSRERGKDQVVVRTAIETGAPTPISVDYAMLSDGGEWKVYDVTIDGVSLVVTYRSSFTNEIRDGGFEGLIARLRAKNAGA